MALEFGTFAAVRRAAEYTVDNADDVLELLNTLAGDESWSFDGTDIVQQGDPGLTVHLGDFVTDTGDTFGPVVFNQSYRPLA